MLTTDERVRIAIAAVRMAVDVDIARSKLFDGEPYDAASRDHREGLVSIAMGYVQVIAEVAESVEEIPDRRDRLTH